jgi:guanosine-3',5'-bis(diphosphate) 3'-pyrophosphohydrolase
VTHPIKPAQEILSATLFAAHKHGTQRRKGVVAEPYINHLVEVAELVAGALTELDTNLIIAAILHDTIEDAGVTSEELTQRFGTDVAELVAEVTDDKLLPKEDRKRLQVEHAPKLSARAQTIKLADKISNLRSILLSPPEDWSLERKREYFRWAAQVVEGLTAPNPALRSEFESTLKRFAEAAQ